MNNDIARLISSRRDRSHLLNSDWHHLCELWDAMRTSRQLPATEWMDSLKRQWSDDFTARIKSVSAQTGASQSEIVDHLEEQVATYRQDPDGEEYTYFTVPKALHDVAWFKEIPQQGRDRGLGL